jgi:hypothetical protein
MDYPLPIDAAGRSVLVILGLGFLRLEGAAWLRGLLPGGRIRPSWLDECARITPLQLAERCSVGVLRAVGGLSLLVLILLWSSYALVRLAEDVAAAPAAAILGAALGIVACRAVCPRGS